MAHGLLLQSVMSNANDTDIQGEGNIEAGRRYQRKTREFVADGRVEEAAEEAAEALDDEEEGPELERARVETKERDEDDE